MSVFSRFLHFVDRRRAFSRVFRVSSTDDKHFFAFFAFRQPTTSVFLHSLALRGVGNTFFSIFHSSEASESHFLQFSTHPRPRKAIFSSFPLIRGLGKPFFPIFCSSEVSDDHFFSFCLRRLSKLKQILTPPLHVLRMICIHCEACLNSSEVLP